MDESAQQVNTIVDNIAEKIGVAAENLLPVAQTAVQEIQTRAATGMFIFGALWLITIVAWLLISRAGLKMCKTEKGDDCDDLGGGLVIGSTIAGVILSGVCLFSIVEFAMEYTAPTLTLIEKLT